MHRRLARAAVLLLASGGCLLVNNNQVQITYDVPPQEFTTPDYGSATGTVPAIDCTQSDAICTQLQAPQGTMASCDHSINKCVLTGDVRLVQTINLSTEKDFPSDVANSSAIQAVTINAVYFWTPTNTLTFATPPIDVYVGSQTVQTETDAGATQLGTLPPLPAMTITCHDQGDAQGHAASCTLPLTDAGKAALGMFAKDYKTPFNVLVVAHLHFAPGDPLPGGKLDMWVMPEVAFGIPLK